MAAGRKEYEMLFQLNAQLGSSYNGTFSKAQSQVAAMQKEISTLSKTQSDISAYQKQQSAIEASRQKLAVLQQQYDNIQREIQETGEYSSDLENKLLAKQQQIERTTASIERQSDKLNQMGHALNEAGVDTNNLQGESARLGKEIDELKEKQEEAADSATGFGEQASAAFGAIQTAIASAGIAEALKEIVEAYMECVTVSGDFEAGMSNVEALSGATAEELAVLTATAKELGATTVFTAQQSADAMGYMAMAGWDAADMVSGIDGVLQLAAASGEDLALVSDIVTDNLTAFGLTAADTARFADVLAAAATNSNTSVSVMGETFKMSASIAGALGYSVEDVAVAVGLMANSGIKGSIAGTALKNTFNGLLEGVTITGAAFGEYEYSAIQADGTMKDFSGTIDELRYYFDQMTEAERVNNAMTIAGARGYNGLLAILNATDADYASLTDSINSCTGAASKMAAIKLDNLNGDLAIMNSAWEGLQITLGDLYNSEMRSLYTLGGEIFAMLDQFIQQNPALAKGILAFVAALAAGTAALTAYAAITKVVIPLMKLFTASIPGVGVIMAVVAGVAALTGVIVGLAEAADEEAAAVRGMTEASREDYYQLQDMRAEYSAVCETYGETSEEAMYLAWQIDELNDSFINSKQTLQEYVEESDAASQSMQEMLQSNRDAYEEISFNEGTTLALVSRLQQLASQTDQTVETQEEMKAIITELNGIVPELALSYEDVVNGVTDYAAAIEATVKAEAAKQKYEQGQQGMVDALNAQYEAEQRLAEAKENQTSAQNRYNQAYRDYCSTMDTYSMNGQNPFAGITMWLTSEQKGLNAAEDALATYNSEVEKWEDNLSRAQAEYQEYLDDQVAYIEAMEEEISTAEALNDRITETTTRMQELAEAYTLAYEAAYSSVSGQYALWEEAAEVVATSAGTINDAIDSQITYWQNYNSNLQSLTERSKDIEGLSDMIASFADGSTESVNAIAGMATASDEELAAMVEDWQTLQGEQDNVAKSIAELNTNFTAEMDKLQQELAADIEAMNLSEDAATSGKNTIQGFINGATDMLPQVTAAYARIAQAAMNAIDSTLDINSPSKEMEYRAEMTWDGYINQTKAMEPELTAAMSEAANAGADATATDLQLLTFAPQLIAAMNAYRGADVAEAHSADRSTSTSVQVTFQITGDATPEVVEALDLYGAEFADRVISIIEEAGVDAARRSY